MNIKNQILSLIEPITLLLLIALCNSTCEAQIKSNNSLQEKIIIEFCTKLKDSNIEYKLDTSKHGLGVYETFAPSYFDKNEMLKNFKDDTSYYSTNAKFLLIQQFTGVLQNYLKKIPAENLKIIDYTKSKSLNKDWQKNSDIEEITMIKNSSILVYTTKEREIELMIINFSKKSNKIVFLTSTGMSMEDSKFIEGLLIGK